MRITRHLTARRVAAAAALAAGLTAARRLRSRSATRSADVAPSAAALGLSPEARTPVAIPAYLELEQSFDAGNGWETVERWLDLTPGFRQESYPPDGRGDQDGDRLRYFGGVAQPFSGRFLLYSAPGWASARGRTPVLLVHGANDNPDRAYANPGESGGFGCGSLVCPDTGLMQELASAGYPVFAVGFAHKQGDNLMQAQQVGDAIAIVRARLEVTHVDVVGWSKGFVSARAYASGVGPAWGRGYGSDVRRLISLGGPNGGYDYPFAHGWAHGVTIYPECGGVINAPSPHSAFRCMFMLRRHPELSIDPADGWDNFPGQRQMLARWDHVVGVDASQVDWRPTYYGGRGWTSVGRGIQSAIDAGSLVETLQAHPVPATVETYLLSGAAPTVIGIFNENRAPSDGVVLIASALDHTGIGDVAGTAIIPTANHLQLGWRPDVARQVMSWLDPQTARPPTADTTPIGGPNTDTSRSPS